MEMREDGGVTPWLVIHQAFGHLAGARLVEDAVDEAGAEEGFGFAAALLGDAHAGRSDDS
jgi:hypothetical protein